MDVNNLPSSRLLRLSTVCEIIGHGPEFVRREEAAGRFIKRVRVGERSIAYRADELEQWIQSRQVAN